MSNALPDTTGKEKEPIPNQETTPNKEENVMNWLRKHYSVIITLLFLFSELLGTMQGIRSHSFFQAIFEFLRQRHEEILRDTPHLMKKDIAENVRH